MTVSVGNGGPPVVKGGGWVSKGGGKGGPNKANKSNNKEGSEASQLDPKSALRTAWGMLKKYLNKSDAEATKRAFEERLSNNDINGARKLLQEKNSQVEAQENIDIMRREAIKAYLNNAQEAYERGDRAGGDRILDAAKNRATDYYRQTGNSAYLKLAAAIGKVKEKILELQDKKLAIQKEINEINKEIIKINKEKQERQKQMQMISTIISIVGIIFPVLTPFTTAAGAVLNTLNTTA